MEGAALSGVAAADEVAAALGIDALTVLARRLRAAGLADALVAEHPTWRSLQRARAQGRGRRARRPSRHASWRLTR
jgi:hypothetical protein